MSKKLFTIQQNDDGNIEIKPVSDTPSDPVSREVKIFYMIVLTLVTIGAIIYLAVQGLASIFSF